MTEISATAVMVWPRAVSGKCRSDAVQPFLGVSSLNLGGGNTSPIFSTLQSISSLPTLTHCASR